MYQDTAYNTENLIEQSEGEALGYWQKRINSGKKLSHIKASDDISIGIVKSYLPSEDFFQLRDEAIKEKDDDAKEMFWTEEVLSQQTFSPFTQVFLIFVGLSKVITWFFFPIFTAAAIWGISNGTEVQRYNSFYEILPIYIWFFSVCYIVFLS